MKTQHKSKNKGPSHREVVIYHVLELFICKTEIKIVLGGDCSCQRMAIEFLLSSILNKLRVPAGHTTRQCSFTRDLERGNHQLPGPPPGLPAEAQGNQNRQLAKAAGDYPEEANVEQYHVFTTQKEDPKDELWFGIEVNAVMPAEPQYIHWSKVSITWGREDHPPLMPRPRGYALVLNPIMFSETHTCRFSRVLIDGGSSINLLYRTSMEKLGIPAIQLKPTMLTFHGIMPGHSCTPMGRIQLEVLFGEKDNYRREPI
jgi:hypothetical protein